MAIIKDVLTNFGITCNYNRIRSVSIDADTEVITITVQVYLSKESRDEGSKPLWNEYVYIPFSDIEGDPRDLYYNLMMDNFPCYLNGGEAEVDVQDTDPEETNG